MPLLPRTLLSLNEAFVEVGGNYYCSTWWWRFARRLAEHCEQFTIYAPIGHPLETGDAMPVDLGSMRLVGRPFYRRFVYYYRHSILWRRGIRRQARRLAEEHDLVLVRVPDPAAPLIARTIRGARKPIALLVGGDVGVGSVATEGGNGLVRTLGRAFAAHLRRQERGIARRACMVGIWDGQMRGRFADVCANVVECSSPNLTSEFLFRREDTCQSLPIRLLRVCQLDPVKDFETLLGAMKLLLEQGRDVKLAIAGGVTRPKYAEYLAQRVKELELAARVEFLGNVEFGQKLYDLYRKADIHIISSKWEGLPRCLAEARASCVPTVATAVGGLVTAIRDGQDGLLVAAGDARALATGIAKLIDDRELRRRVIAGGFALAPQSTAEFHAERLARLLAERL